MNPPSFGTDHGRSTENPNQAVKRLMSNLTPTGDWELFLGMWERANLVRAFFWTQRADDEKILLTHFLPRLRRYFGVDFCFGALSVSEDTIVEVGVPEAGLSQLPRDFSPRCLESVANSRAPVIWNDAGIKLGFRTTVIVPLRAPTGASFGFLLLGQSRARSYSAIELFLLQALAGELSWVVRDLAARKAYREKLAAASHDMKNGLQVILGHVTLMRQKMKNLSGEADRHIEGIEQAVELLVDRLQILPESTVAVDAGASGDPLPGGIASALAQSLASCRQAAEERGVAFEIAYTPDPADHSIVISEQVKGLFSAFVDTAASTTRNEIVRLTVIRRGAVLELIVQGSGSNRLAERLKALLESVSRSEGARVEKEAALGRVREYLYDVGGDVYLKSRPGETAEFVVRLPIESSAQPARLKAKIDFEKKDLV